MRRWRIAGVVTAALVAAVVLVVATHLPPKTIALARPAWSSPGAVVRGAYHIHTVRSDGSGTPDEVAAAAARAGLQFVILTDHGDATRTPDPPMYRHGVLCIDAVEISTAAGHYAAIGLPKTPYPLGGEGRDAVEDVARLGGFGIAAHPDSAKAELRWTAWSEPFDGIEWLNGDSEWRSKAWGRLVLLALTYPVRAPESLASLFDNRGGLDRWDRTAVAHPGVFAIAGQDIHSRIGFRQTDPDEGWTLVRWPSYEVAFRTFSLHVVLPSPLRTRAAEDAAAVIGAMRAGKFHTVIDAWAAPAAFEFTAHQAGQVWTEGETVVSHKLPVVFRVRANAKDGRRLVLFRDGVEVDRVATAELVYGTDRPGRYRAEAWLHDVKGGRPVPWVVSNAIRLTDSEAGVPAGGRKDEALTPSLLEIPIDDRWTVEKDPASEGVVGRDPSGAAVTFRLAAATPSGIAPRSPFVSLSHPVAIPRTANGLTFVGSANRPMRVSVQFRVPEPGKQGLRWQHSVYLDSTSRTFNLPLDSFTPVVSALPGKILTSQVDSLLFVVAHPHTRPGDAGSFSISNVAIR